MLNQGKQYFTNKVYKIIRAINSDSCSLSAGFVVYF